MALRRGFSRPSCYLFLTMVVVDSGSVREDECFDSAPFAFCLLTQLSLLFLFEVANILVSFTTSSSVVCDGNNS